MKILVNIDVPELAPAIDFYTAALPLSLGRIIDGDVAELTGAAATLYLLRKPASSRPVEGIKMHKLLGSLRPWLLSYRVRRGKL